ncbi:unnamed protein product [Rotaria sp. Silwood2]|nr:unnamed protein product [Rotaria sp. Silwood2]
MRLALKKLKRYQQTVHQFGIYYYAKMIKLMRPANSHMNESTKEFLKQVKIADNVDIITDISFSYSTTTTTNPASINDFKGYFRDYNDDDYYYCKSHYSYNDTDPQRYLNRISKSSSYNLYEQNQALTHFVKYIMLNCQQILYHRCLMIIHIEMAISNNSNNRFSDVLNVIL